VEVIIFLFLSVAFNDVDKIGNEKEKQVSEWSLRPSEILWCVGANYVPKHTLWQQKHA